MTKIAIGGKLKSTSDPIAVKAQVKIFLLEPSRMSCRIEEIETSVAKLDQSIVAHPLQCGLLNGS